MSERLPAEYVRETVQVPVLVSFDIQCRPEERDWVVAQAVDHLHVSISGCDIHHGSYDYTLRDRRLIDGPEVPE